MNGFTNTYKDEETAAYAVRYFEQYGFLVVRQGRTVTCSKIDPKIMKMMRQEAEL